MKDATPPRFVPILTEVVSQAVSVEPLEASVAPAGQASLARPDLGAPATPEGEVARRVMARVLLELEPIVLDALRSVHAQQARALEVLVRTELAARVAHLVDDALREPPSND